MHISARRRRKAAIAATLMGAVLICAALLTGLGGGEEATPSQTESNAPQRVEPFDDGVGGTDDRAASAGRSDVLSQLTGTSGGDPFTRAAGSDNTVHDVVIRFVSDGGMYAGWRYRTKGGEGLKVASKSLTLSRKVRGGLPVAQAAVQTLSSATYSRCTIFVDGVEVSSQTAKGPNRVTVCLG